VAYVFGGLFNQLLLAVLGSSAVGLFQGMKRIDWMCDGLKKIDQLFKGDIRYETIL